MQELARMISGVRPNVSNRTPCVISRVSLFPWKVCVCPSFFPEKGTFLLPYCVFTLVYYYMWFFPCCKAIPSVFSLSLHWGEFLAKL